MSRRVTLALTAVSTLLLAAAVPMLDSSSGLPVMATMLVLAALAVGTVAISRAWARPGVDQPSAEGSVAGPT